MELKSLRKTFFFFFSPKILKTGYLEASGRCLKVQVSADSAVSPAPVAVQLLKEMIMQSWIHVPFVSFDLVFIETEDKCFFSFVFCWPRTVLTVLTSLFGFKPHKNEALLLLKQGSLTSSR